MLCAREYLSSPPIIRSDRVCSFQAYRVPQELQYEEMCPSMLTPDPWLDVFDQFLCPGSCRALVFPFILLAI